MTSKQSPSPPGPEKKAAKPAKKAPKQQPQPRRRIEVMNIAATRTG